MGNDVIDFGRYHRRRLARQASSLWGRANDFFGLTPSVIVRMLVLMFDAPDDPPLVKLAWLLTHFGEVTMPGGKTYRLERGSFEEKDGDQWVPSTVAFNDLVKLASGFKRDQWQWVARNAKRRKSVCSMSQWLEYFNRDDPRGS
jgi:hypothetical protein